MEDESAGGTSKGVAITSWIVLSLVVLVLGRLVWWHFAVFPTFEAIFTDMGSKLPLSTRLLMATPASAVAIASLILCLGLVAKELAIRRKMFALAINLGVGLGALLLREAYAHALMAPMVALIEAVQN